MWAYIESESLKVAGETPWREDNENFIEITKLQGHVNKYSTAARYYSDWNPNQVIKRHIGSHYTFYSTLPLKNTSARKPSTPLNL